MVDGLKLTPANPSFLQARDAVLLALDHMLDQRRISRTTHQTVRQAAQAAFGRLVHIRASVVLQRAGTSLFVRDATGTVFCETHATTPVAVGDIVDIKANAAVHKGMPHKFYHGRTGVVFNVTKSAVGVIVNKRVGNRFVEKRVNLRVEHVRHSKCRDDFLRRVKENAAKRADAKAKGVRISLKRIPEQPRTSHFVRVKGNAPTTITPIPYDTLI